MITLASPSAFRPAATVSELIKFFAPRGQPAISQYSGEERVEISGRVLVNWFNKSVNLFAAEYGTLSENSVFIAPVHWKTVIIALAAKASGSEIFWSATSIGDGGVEEIDFDLGTATLFTHEEAPAIETLQDSPAEIVQINLETLAQEFEGELDPFGLDFALEALSQADQLLAPLHDSELPEPAEGNLLVISAAALDALKEDAEARKAFVVVCASAAEVFEKTLSHWAGGGSVTVSDDANAAAALRQERPSVIAVLD